MTKPIPSPLEALQTSLQMEFEFELAKYNPKDDILRAKKRQLELLKHIMAPTHQIIKAKTTDRPVLKWTYVDGKLTPDRVVKSALPSITEIIDDLFYIKVINKPELFLGY